MNYALLIALGLMFMVLVTVVLHPTARIATAVLSAVCFLLAAIAALTGSLAGLG